MTIANRNTLSATSLIGDKVKNEQGKDLGKIDELMIDLSTGHVAYAVLSFGGFMGFGDKLFAVPWKSLHLDADDHSFILNVDQEVLSASDGFDHDDWPDMSDRDWGGRIHSKYSVAPYWEG